MTLPKVTASTRCQMHSHLALVVCKAMQNYARASGSSSFSLVFITQGPTKKQDGIFAREL